MPIRPDGASTVLFELEMMDVPEDRLEKQQDENSYSDNGMIAVKQADGKVVDHPHTEAERNDV